MADPTVIRAIVQAATKYKADPVALLATALQESGATWDAVGDGGHSHGPYQFNDFGAGAGKSIAWRDSAAAVDNRASEFARLGIHGGRGAAALQRPADPTGYAAAVDNWKAQARALLAEHGGSTAAPPPTMASAVRSPPSASLPGGVGVSAAAQQRTSFLQSIIDQNAQLAGIAPVSVPMPVLQSLPPASATSRKGEVPKQTPLGARAKRVGAYDLPTASRRVIGTPYAGTHTIGNWESDNAIDLATPVGSPIYAAQDGTIGSQFGSLGASSGSRFAGLRLHLKTQGNEFYYAHLSRFAPGIKPGARVRAGQIIGYSGSANGVAHLHIGARSGNPLQLFKLGSR